MPAEDPKSDGDGGRFDPDSWPETRPQNESDSEETTVTMNRDGDLGAFRLHLRLCRFEGLQKVTQGGMGELFRGRDTELNRALAIKSMREDLAQDSELIARFFDEALIGGQLQHPGIVPVYEIGQLADDRPFFAMKWIKGRTLGVLLKSRSSPVGELPRFLKIFEQICEAMSYAHTKRVIHRDLKPENVMVGDFGEVQVMDWGLAKVLGSHQDTNHDATQVSKIHTRRNEDGSDLTRHGDFMGTAAYMSPEQANGETDQLDERTDVFALGSILCEILTGFAAYRDPSKQTKAKLADLVDAFARLELCNADPELIAIATSCLARTMEERPRNASVVASLITSYLLSVQERLQKAEIAQAEANERAAAEKSRRKYVAMISGILVLAACGLAAGLIAVGGLNVRLKRANTSLDQQRRRAEDREARAIDAMERFGNVVASEPGLKNSPALAGLRKRLLNEPIAFYRELRECLQADHDTQPESLARVASANFNLGRLTDELGDQENAITYYRESLEIRQNLANLYPNVASYRSDLAFSYRDIGTLLDDNAKSGEAMKNFELALAIRRKLADENPDVASYRSELASSLATIGILLKAVGKPDEAKNAYESALAIRRRLADEDPGNALYQADLADSYNHIGNLLWTNGKSDEAMKVYDLALNIRQKLFDVKPKDIRFRGDLAFSHDNIGRLLSEVGTHGEAMKAYKSALEIRQKLADENPNVTRFQASLAASQNNIGRLLSETRKPDEAMKAYELALAIRQKLALYRPESPEFASDLGNTLNNMAMIDLNEKRFFPARDRLRQAVDSHRAALALNPANLTYRQFLTNALGNLISASGQLHDAEGVAAASRELSKIRETKRH